MAFKLIPRSGWDVVVSIRLNEAREMLFARKAAADDGAKFRLVLPRRSAAVFNCESRLD